MLNVLIALNKIIQEQEEQIRLKEIKLNTVKYAVDKLELEYDKLQRINSIYNRKKNDFSIVSSYSTGTKTG
jgi:hypothetical protein